MASACPIRSLRGSTRGLAARRESDRTPYIRAMRPTVSPAFTVWVRLVPVEVVRSKLELLEEVSAARAEGEEFPAAVIRDGVALDELGELVIGGWAA